MEGSLIRVISGIAWIVQWGGTLYAIGNAGRLNVPDSAATPAEWVRFVALPMAVSGASWIARGVIRGVQGNGKTGTGNPANGGPGFLYQLAQNAIAGNRQAGGISTAYAQGDLATPLANSPPAAPSNPVIPVNATQSRDWLDLELKRIAGRLVAEGRLDDTDRILAIVKELAG